METIAEYDEASDLHEAEIEGLKEEMEELKKGSGDEDAIMYRIDEAKEVWEEEAAAATTELQKEVERLKLANQKLSQRPEAAEEEEKPASVAGAEATEQETPAEEGGEKEKKKRRKKKDKGGGDDAPSSKKGKLMHINEKGDEKKRYGRITPDALTVWKSKKPGDDDEPETTIALAGAEVDLVDDYIEVQDSEGKEHQFMVPEGAAEAEEWHNALVKNIGILAG